MSTNNSIVAGTSGVFQMFLEPAGSVSPNPGAPTWSADDPAVVITPDPSDPTGETVDVAVPLTDTGTSFTLSVTAPDGAAGAAISGSATITIVQPPPPAPTSLGIKQLS